MGFFDTIGDLLGDKGVIKDVATVATSIFGNNDKEEVGSKTARSELSPNLKAFSDAVIARGHDIFSNMQYPTYTGQRTAGPTEWMNYASDLGRNAASASGARSWNNRNRAETGDIGYQSPYLTALNGMYGGRQQQASPTIEQIMAMMQQGGNAGRQNTAVSGGPRSDDAYLKNNRGYGRAPWMG